MTKQMKILMLLTALTTATAACTSDLDTAPVATALTYDTATAGGGTSGTGDRIVTLTPAANSLVVVCAALTGNTQAAPTMTDNRGGTYDLINQATWGGGTNNAMCFVRTALIASSISHSITLDTDTNTAGELVAITFAGSYHAGLAAVRQSAVTAEGAASTAPAATFATSALTTSPTIAIVASGDTTTTPPSGWTERKDASQATPTTALEVATRASGFTGTAITAGATQSTTYATIVIELDASQPDVDAGVDADPTIACPGAHGIVSQLYGHGMSPAQITLNTTASDSLFIVSMGGKSSDIDNGPTDNYSNAYSLVGNVEDYTDWSGYGTATWRSTTTTGGTGHTWSQYVTQWQEITMFALEVPGAGANPTITTTFNQSSNATSPTQQTTTSVTTTGPATLVTWWDGASPTNHGNHVATPNNGFTVLEGYGYDDPDGYVQAFMACRTVAGAGTYDVTWSYTPAQGAQTRLMAIQP